MSAARTAPSRHLILSLHDLSWGRTVLGLAIAEDLRRGGADVHLLVHATNEPLLRDGNIPYDVVPSHVGPLTGLVLASHVERLRPDVIILCDYFGNCNYVHRMGVDGLPPFPDQSVVAVDLWDFDRTGPFIDRATGAVVGLCHSALATCVERFGSETTRIVPVPIAPLSGTTQRMKFLPQFPPGLDRNSGRRCLGLSDSDLVVLTTTSRWQHAAPGNGAADSMSSVPRLLESYLAALGTRVHWIHVGPAPFGLAGRLADHYKWIPPLSRHEMDDLLAAADLLLSVNVSASTTVKAIVAGTPVLLVQNSYDLADLAKSTDGAPPSFSPTVDEWLRNSGPPPPFALWPLGYFEFTHPLIDQNEFFTAVHRVELLYEDECVSALDALLTDQDTRERSGDAQARYLTRVDALPGPEQLLAELL